MNANEQTDLHLTIKNDSDESYDNVKAVLRTNNRLVKINDSIAQINSISANETFSITEGFNFSVEATADHKTILGLDVYFYNENEDIISVTRIPIKVQDKALNFATVVVKNDDNGNGILEYSETADFGIVINNIGNEIYNSSKSEIKEDCS